MYQKRCSTEKSVAQSSPDRSRNLCLLSPERMANPENTRQIPRGFVFFHCGMVGLHGMILQASNVWNDHQIVFESHPSHFYLDFIFILLCCRAPSDKISSMLVVFRT